MFCMPQHKDCLKSPKRQKNAKLCKTQQFVKYAKYLLSRKGSQAFNTSQDYGKKTWYENDIGDNESGKKMTLILMMLIYRQVGSAIANAISIKC